jgi:two-component system chemotaxis sensor kinase CheA
VADTPAESPVEAAPQMPASAAAADANIRVAVRTLDHLMNLAGELVLARNQLLQTVAARDRGNLDSVSARLNQVTSEIQEAVMQTRLQAVDTVFSKFPRIVRDLCNALGKQCDLVIEGEDVELDKSIIEAIGDPLTHLIRNAVDHGLETPDDRVRAGKQPRGRILLKAFHQAGKVHLAVGDDGSGINVAKLKEQAVARGIISAEQARDLGDHEAARLIFRPGLSTAEQLTNLSGRGVGMDVVKTNIERLGGTVEVESILGAGTTIGITLPLTLAIIPSLIVSCDGRRFAIPQASISELVMVKAANVAERVQKIKNAEVLRLRGHLLPLVRLRTALGLDGAAESVQFKPEGAGNVNVIVLDSGRLSYGLVVDTLHDSEEIVVKPLGKHIKDCRCFAGATILGDGQVALILDVAGLSAQAELSSGDERQVAEAAATGIAATIADQDAHAMLLFTNGPGEQFAVPMGLISRLERIRAEQIDSVGGQEVLQYRGGSLPLLSLEKFIKAQPRPQLARLYVVVFRVGQREVGMIAPQLTDIRHVSTNVDTMTLREPGVIGSMVLDGKTTRLLDLFELTHTARPDWFREDPAAAAKPAEGKNILLVEDSGFFRRQLTSFFQADGYTVRTCVDGQDAWETLCQPGENYDLIVTDLDMPRMNGFELAEKIRANPAWKNLPIIAVTSLASDEDMERGQAVDINEYHIKLDRDRLMATVAGFLRAKRHAAGQPVSATCGGRI